MTQDTGLRAILNYLTPIHSVLVGLGLPYDLWTLNGQVSESNRRELTAGCWPRGREGFET